jgi:hypothetical protein
MIPKTTFAAIAPDEHQPTVIALALSALGTAEGSPALPALLAAYSSNHIQVILQ